MYSVVLMMALTTGADLPAHHRGGCWGGGCNGYAAACCEVNYGGCWGGHARHHRRFGHRRGGCWGGSGYGCNGGYGYGCNGGYASCGCCGGSAGYVGGCWGGCTGSMGGCWGGAMSAPVITGPVGPATTPPPPPPPPPGKRPERVAPPKGTMAPAPAVIIVNLPAEATLRVDGHLTHSTSTVRTFASPALQPGQSYAYTLKAECMHQGQTVAQTRRVSVRAGEQTRVEFQFGTTRVVQK